MMTCHDVQHRLHAFLDEALDSGERQQVQNHVDDCPSCQAEVAEVSNLESRLRTTFQDEEIPDTLWARIQTNIEVTDPSLSPIKSSGWGGPWTWATAAAVLFVVLSVTMLRPLWLPGSRQAQLLSIPVEDLHTFVVSQRGLDVNSTGSEQLRQWFWEKVDFSPPVLPVRIGQAKLIGGRLCHFLDRRVAAFMYRAEGHYLAVNVMPRKGLTLPVQGDGKLETPLGTIHDVKGYTHILWSQSDLLYSLVSDLPQKQLADMAKVIGAAGQTQL